MDINESLDDDEEFAWSIVQPEIDQMAKWSNMKFCENQ